MSISEMTTPFSCQDYGRGEFGSQRFLVTDAKEVRVAICYDQKVATELVNLLNRNTPDSLTNPDQICDESLDQKL